MTVVGGWSRPAATAEGQKQADGAGHRTLRNRVDANARWSRWRRNPRRGRCSAPVVAAALLRPAAARPLEGVGAGLCRAQAARAGRPRPLGHPRLAATSAGGGREGPSCVIPGALALGSSLPEPSLDRAPGSTREACRQGRGPCSAPAR